MNGKAWLGRLLSRTAPGPAKATRKASRRPASPLRELEQEQAALRARDRLAAFRKTCWLVVLIQLCLLAAMLASFHFFLPEL